MSVRRVQQEVDSWEFTAWQVYDELDPGDPERSDVRSAMLCSVVANAHRSKGRAFTPKDFMLDFSPPPARQDKRGLKNKANAWLAQFREGQRDERR